MNDNYTTTLSTRPFLFQETKQVVELLKEGMSEEEVAGKVLKDNLFLLKSQDRTNSFTSEILKRVSQLDEFLQQKFLECDVQTSKTILLYAILKKDRLFYEWMREIIRDKFLVLDMKITKNETELFLDYKGEQSEKVRKWTDATKKRLTNAFHNTIEEAGMLRKEEREEKLQYLMLDPEIVVYLKESKEKHIVEVLLGE